MRTFSTNGRPRIFLAVAFGVWLAQKIYLVYLWLRLNILVAGHNEATISHFDHGALKVNAMLLEITLSRPLQLHYGQYVHITVPTIPHTLIGRLQSHPYLIAWADGGISEPSRRVSLLIECRSGFSDRLRLCRNPTAVSFHGPYGSSQSLEMFDRVLFMASGIGIAAHLLAAQRLLQAHNAQTSRVRRVSLLWFLDTEGKHDVSDFPIGCLKLAEQELWARVFLDALMDLDRRRIFTVVMYRPFNGKNLAATAPGQVLTDQTKDRWYRVNGALDVPWFISKEWTAEAGTMAISRTCYRRSSRGHGLTVLVVCGTPMFEHCVRRALRSMTWDITLICSDFQIDESEDSHTASFRFRNVPKSTPIQ